jgi:hypothetical protein
MSRSKAVEIGPTEATLFVSGDLKSCGGGEVVLNGRKMMGEGSCADIKNIVTSIISDGNNGPPPSKRPTSTWRRRPR